jgi:hypothetical protein
MVKILTGTVVQGHGIVQRGVERVRDDQGILVRPDSIV